jgi:hypothetical protein
MNNLNNRITLISSITAFDQGSEVSISGGLIAKLKAKLLIDDILFSNIFKAYTNSL